MKKYKVLLPTIDAHDEVEVFFVLDTKEKMMQNNFKQ